MAANLAQGEQIRHGEVAPVGQSGVEAGGGVALGEDKAVPILPAGIGGVDAHLFKVEVGKQVCGGQRAAGMSGLGGVGALDDTHAHLAGGHRQLLFFSCGHSFKLLFT